MERRRYIIYLFIGFVWISCTKAPVFEESLVPEIVSITSIPETHSAVLKSDLNTAPFGRVDCGFYYGTDKTNLKRVNTALAGKSFSMILENLQESTTYYFKAFISNGVNEIASGFESFITEPEPVGPVEPEDPVEPDQPTDPEPEDPIEPEQPTDPEPEDPVEPEQPTDPEPEDPTEPEVPVEFTTEIIGLSASVNDYIAELTAELGGDTSLVKECWFMAGFTSDRLSKIKGTIEGPTVKAYLAGIDPGTTLWFKAVISDGTETKESELCSFSL